MSLSLEDYSRGFFRIYYARSREDLVVSPLSMNVYLRQAPIQGQLLHLAESFLKFFLPERIKNDQEKSLHIALLDHCLSLHEDWQQVARSIEAYRRKQRLEAATAESSKAIERLARWWDHWVQHLCEDRPLLPRINAILQPTVEPIAEEMENVWMQARWDMALAKLESETVLALPDKALADIARNRPISQEQEMILAAYAADVQKQSYFLDSRTLHAAFCGLARQTFLGASRSEIAIAAGRQELVLYRLGARSMAKVDPIEEEGRSWVQRRKKITLNQREYVLGNKLLGLALEEKEGKDDHLFWRVEEDKVLLLDTRPPVVSCCLWAQKQELEKLAPLAEVYYLDERGYALLEYLPTPVLGYQWKSLEPRPEPEQALKLQSLLDLLDKMEKEEKCPYYLLRCPLSWDKEGKLKWHYPLEMVRCDFSLLEDFIAKLAQGSAEVASFLMERSGLTRRPQGQLYATAVQAAAKNESIHWDEYENQVADEGVERAKALYDQVCELRYLCLEKNKGLRPEQPWDFERAVLAWHQKMGGMSQLPPTEAALEFIQQKMG